MVEIDNHLNYMVIMIVEDIEQLSVLTHFDHHIIFGRSTWVIVKSEP